MFLEEVAGGN